MIEDLLLKIKRAETPFFKGLKSLARAFFRANLPIPRFLFPLLRTIYNLHIIMRSVFWRCLSIFYFEPLFRSRCVSIGKNFSLNFLPDMDGHTEITIGEGVNFFGKVSIYTGHIFDHPRLEIGNRVDLGHNVVFVVNKEIVIEDDVNVASGVRFMDSDAHPRDAMERIADLPPRPEEIKPVRIGRYAWIGQNSFILKGVTIGEGSIVGVNSVVLTDVPPYCVVMGNPAKVIARNINQSAPAKPEQA